MVTLVDPANPPSRKAPLVWAIGAAIPWTVLAVAQVVWFVLDGRPALAARRRGRGAPCSACVMFVGGRAAVALPRAPLGRSAPQAVYTRTGWLVQERRIAPISRVQTVDTHRGPLDRLFGLANVTVTTASSAGAVRIVALDSDVADRIVAQLTDIAAIGERGRDVTLACDRAGWHRLSPRMLLVHPVHEVLRQLPLLIGVGGARVRRRATRCGRSPRWR